MNYDVLIDNNCNADTKIIPSRKKIKIFACDKCKKTFKRSNVLKYHLQTHTGEKPFKCPKCKKTYGQNFELNRHIKKIHKKIYKLHECNICDKNFVNKCDLLDHI